MDHVSVLLTYFKNVSKNQLFIFNPNDLRRTNLNDYKLRARWFNPYQDNSIAGWVVSHFEARIFLAFTQKIENPWAQKNPLTNREIFIDIWRKMPEKERDDLVRRTVDKLHRFSDYCFCENKDTEVSEKYFDKMRGFNAEERVFKTIMRLKQINVTDKSSFKQSMFESIKKKMDSKNGDIFIKLCINSNFQESIQPENLFMNMIFEFLEQIYFEKFLLQMITEEEEPSKKKKKGKKKKNGTVELSQDPSNISEIFSKPANIIVNSQQEVSISTQFQLFSNDLTAHSECSQPKTARSPFPKIDNVAPEMNLVSNGGTHKDLDKLPFPEKHLNPATEVTDKNLQQRENELTKEKEILAFECREDLKTPLLTGIKNEDNEQTNNLPEIPDFTDPQVELHLTRKNSSRKGSMSVDLLVSNRTIPVENDQKYIPIPDKKNSRRDHRNFKPTKIEEIKNLSPDSDQDIKISILETKKKNKEPFKAIPDNEDVRSVSQKSDLFSHNESKSVSVCDSLASNNQNTSKKNPKLRKIVKDAPYKKGSYQNNSGTLPPQYNLQYPKQETSTHKDSGSVNSFVQSKMQPVKQNTANLKEVKPIQNPKEDQTKPKKVVKTTNTKPKKVGENPPKITFAKWEESDKDQTIILEAPSVSVQSHPVEKSLSLKVNRNQYSETMPLKTDNYSIRNSGTSNPVSLNQTESTNPKSNENQAKKNIFRFQNQKNVIEYYPINSYESTMPMVFDGEPIEQNKYSMSDQKNSGLVSAVYLSTLRLCKTPDVIIDDELHRNSKELLMNKVLVRITRILDMDIMNIFEWLDVYNKRIEAPRLNIISQIGDIVSRSFSQGIAIKPYGSFVSGLLTPFSDVDIAIVGGQIFEKEKANEMLRLVRDNIMLCNLMLNSTIIENTQVPVLKFESNPQIIQEDPSSSVIIKIDLIVDIDDGINDFNTAFRTTDYIQYCKSNCNTFLRNTLILKYIVNFHNLSNTYFGNLIRRHKLIRTLSSIHRLH